MLFAQALIESERLASRSVNRVGAPPKSGDDNPEAITLGLHHAPPATSLGQKGDWGIAKLAGAGAGTMAGRG